MIARSSRLDRPVPNSHKLKFWDVNFPSSIASWQCNITTMDLIYSLLLSRKIKVPSTNCGCLSFGFDTNSKVWIEAFQSAEAQSKCLQETWKEEWTSKGKHDPWTKFLLISKTASNVLQCLYIWENKTLGSKTHNEIRNLILITTLKEINRNATSYMKR